MGNKIIVIIAIILFPISCLAADYLDDYIQSRGGSIRYQAEEPEHGNDVNVNIYIENNQPAPNQNYYYPRPIFPQNLDTWRYGSPHDIKEWNFGHDYYQRHPRWRK